jgi:CubicO group peptidase (beta-lactamase class C family)
LKLNEKQIKILDIFLVAVAMVIVALNIFKRCSSEPTTQQKEAAVEFTSINQLISNDLSSSDQTRKLDNQVEKFLKRWEIKGGSLAIMKEGKLIYAKGYGWADEEQGIRTEPGNIFRVASLSKLITATAIMKMAEDSLLNLDDKVFGKDGILNEEQFSHYRDKRVPRITVEHLLRHKGGFSTYRGDPLFCTRDIMIWEKLDTVPDMDRVIEFALSQRLGFTPGGSTKYSNVGYLILTRIIEKLSGMSYEEYCQKNILYPSGCYDMHLAKNLYQDKYPNEVRYYEPHDATPIPAYNNSGDTLYRRYGGNNIEGLYGAGGWVSSASEFVMFVSHIDGNSITPDILSEKSIEKMVKCSGGELPIGWSRAGVSSEWRRTGTLAGSSALVKKQKDGTIWMFVTNTSSWKGSKFPGYIETMVRRGTTGIEFPDQNLLEFI